VKRFSLSALPVIAAVALYFTSGSSLAALAVGLLLVLGLLGPRLVIPPRGVALLALVSVVGTFLVQPPVPRAGGFLFEPALALSGGLFSCFGSAVLLLRKSKGWEEQLILVTSTVTLVVAGNTTSAFPFAYLVGLYTVFLVLYLRSLSFGTTPRTIVSTGISLLFALALAVALSWSEAGFNSLFTSMQSWSSSVNFGEVASIKPQSGPGGMKVLVRVFSEDPENYLAARRYVEYRANKWKAVPAQTASPESYHARSAYFLRGELPEKWSAKTQDRIEITTLGPEALLAPLNTRVLTVELEKAAINWCGDLLVEEAGGGFTGSYQVALGPNPLEEEADYLQSCLEAEVAPEVSALAREVAGEGPDAIKVARLVQYFQENFEYGFGYPFERSQDPVADFLRERPAAHCEVFATCLALMCRQVGVPARYVQGFLVREKNEWGDYWVSRERDAHAWVEVYIQGKGWVQVDSTPPGVSAPVESSSSWSEFIDVAKRLVQRAFAYLSRGPSALMNDVYGLVQKYPLPTALALLGLIGWRLRKRFKRPTRGLVKTVATPPHPNILKLQSMLSELERIADEPRPRGMTLLEWAEKVPSVASFLKAYSEVRYSRPVPDETALSRLIALLEEVRPNNEARP